MSKVLMIAVETGRWGPARLIAPLTEAGFEIAVFCPSSNLISKSSHVKRFFELRELKSWRQFAKSLNAALEAWQPTLIMPCDEQVIAALHFVIRRKLKGGNIITDANLQILLCSIGLPDKLDAMIFKSETRQLAMNLGIAVPTGARVDSASKAIELAEQLGFPVFIKKSFSWAGRGTMMCANAAEVSQAFSALNPKKSFAKDVIRTLLGRDWYPTNSATEVQKALPGISAMFNVVAWRGQYLGGFFGRREQTVGGSGPSTIVSIGPNAICEASAKKLVRALGASGFWAFDFMWDQASSAAVLLECNPRPNQVSHLGPSIGADLCAALAKACAGESLEIPAVTHIATVPLFPQEWLRDEQNALTQRQSLDIPNHDPKLLDVMLREGQKIGRSVQRLNLAPV